MIVMKDRHLLMNVAYRLLGSVSEAEDAVQEAYTRWYALAARSRDDVASPTGWLITAVSRICLDVLGSARARREQYVGQFLPEPVPATLPWTGLAALDRAADASDRLALDDSLRMALLVVLESMTPAERVAFILHDVFNFTFVEISAIVSRSPQACRQLASSARRRVRGRSERHAARNDHRGVVAAFKAAWETGDLTALMAVLDPEAVAVTDGGGLVSAALEPIHGAERIARFFLDVHQRQPDLVVETAAVNGQAGLVARDQTGRALAVVSVAVANALIERFWTMRNPAKLDLWRE